MKEIRGLCIFRALLCCVFSLGVMVGCAEGDEADWGPEDSEEDEFCEDLDGDGYLGLTARCPRGTDCNDLDASVHPGATEICGDGIDNDCSNGDAPCERDCVDLDGDGYGVGPGCLGPDCDDNNPNIHPGAVEICGNGIDDNCDGNDAVCPVDCVDMDGDGYGIAGQNSDCPFEGDDCDDSDASVNPGAQEVCSGVDNNCDGRVDECERDGATCSGTGPNDSCVVAVGWVCSSDDECADPARCDANVSKCRLPAGESCANTNECLDGYVCQDGVCNGDFCEINACDGFCSAEAERCLECDPDAPGEGGCTGGQTCSHQGYCAPALLLTDSDPVSGHPEVTNEIYALSLAIADCWIDYRSPDKDQMCQLLYLGDDVGPITEGDMKDAFKDGKLRFIDAARHEALHDLWGNWGGLGNVKNIKWRDDPQPGSFLEYCVWYDKVALLPDKVNVGKCSDFSP